MNEPISNHKPHRFFFDTELTQFSLWTHLTTNLFKSKNVKQNEKWKNDREVGSIGFGDKINIYFYNVVFST